MKSAQRPSALATREVSKFRWLARAGSVAVVVVSLTAVPASDTALLITVAAVAPVLALCWIINDEARSCRLARLVRELRADR